jgi:hypothetical protein
MRDRDIFPLSRLRGPGGGLVRVFHGSPCPTAFTEFRAPGFKPRMQLGFGIHFTGDQSFAELYANAGGGRRGQVLACKLDLRNPIDISRPLLLGTPGYAFARDLFRGSRVAHLWPMFSELDQVILPIDRFDQRRVVRKMEEHGIDGIIYEAKHGTPVFGGMSISARAICYVALRPDQVSVIGPVPAPDHSLAKPSRPGVRTDRRCEDNDMDQEIEPGEHPGCGV